MRLLPLILAACLIAGAAFAQVPTTGAGAGTPGGGTVAFITPLFLLGSTTTALPSNTTNYNMMVGSSGGSSWAPTSASRIIPLPIPGKFSGLEVISPVASITTGTETFSLFGVTGSPSCIFQTGTPSACSDHATLSSDVAAGTAIAIQAVGAGTPGPTLTGPVQLSVNFTGDNVNESLIFGGSTGNASASAINFMGAGSIWGATENVVSFVMPTAGVLDSLYVIMGNNAGANAGYSYPIFKNGQTTNVVAGNGSTTCWGAASTACNDIAGCAASTPCTHSISVVAGDTISIESCPSTANNTLLCPNQLVGAACSACIAPSARGISFALRWMPTINKEAIVVGTPSTFPATNSGASRFTLAAGAGTSDATNVNETNIIPYTTTSQVYKKWAVAYCTGSGVASTARTVSLETPLGTSVMTTGSVATTATIACPAAGSPFSTGAGNFTQDNSNTYTTPAPVTDGLQIVGKTINTLAPPAYTLFKQAFVAVVN